MQLPSGSRALGSLAAGKARPGPGRGKRTDWTPFFPMQQPESILEQRVWIS